MLRKQSCHGGVVLFYYGGVVGLSNNVDEIVQVAGRTTDQHVEATEAVTMFQSALPNQCHEATMET